MSKKHSHYHKDVSDRQTIDIYGICEVFEVDDVSGRLHHAIKKILMAGKRGSKGYRQDIQEAVDTLNEKILALDGNSGIKTEITIEPCHPSRLHSYSRKCLVCGSDEGHGGLGCPIMAVTNG